MDIEYESANRGRHDPRFDEGLAHVQAGEWDAALRMFEELNIAYPGDPDVLRLLDQARFKARLDKETRVKPKGVTIRWRRLFVRFFIAVALIALALVTIELLRARVGPALAQARAEREFAQQVDSCRSLVEGGKLQEAREACGLVLGKDPNNEEVKALLLRVDSKEKEQQICQEAEALLAEGEYARALERLTDIQLLFPNTCKAPERISMLRERQSLEGLFQQGRAAFDAGDCQGAVDAYEQIRVRSTDYEAETIRQQLHSCYLRLGQNLVEQQPPQVEQLPLALDYFTRALSFQPRESVAQGEQRLVSQFLAGQQSFETGRLDDAIQGLASVVGARPGYLDGLAAQRLYDAYLRRGDQHRDAADYSMAYRMYDLASQVPGVDPASAINRRDSVTGLLTPTPTPTNTPTETPIPTATPYVPPKPTALPTPAPPLGTLRGKIVFYSAKEDQEGMWVMNPDGSQKRFLGRVTPKMQQEYDAIRARESYSPDGRYRLYALKDKDDSTVQVYFQGYNQDGYLVTKQVTNCSKICYDPVWAPDGSRIALVSPEWESDDIWVINPDGAEWWNFTPNKWEWEKHPSWSPDSRKIVFWSNREGTKQIYVIDADGRNLKKISGDAPWDEYDPLWIK